MPFSIWRRVARHLKDSSVVRILEWVEETEMKFTRVCSSQLLRMKKSSCSLNNTESTRDNSVAFIIDWDGSY